LLIINAFHPKVFLTVAGLLTRDSSYFPHLPGTNPVAFTAK